MLLQWTVPADVLTASKGSVGAMVGIVGLLLALVLGLLVWTAFSRLHHPAVGGLFARAGRGRHRARARTVRAGGRWRAGGPARGAAALAGPVFRRRRARPAALHLRGDAGDPGGARRLFRQPQARDRPAAALLDKAWDLARKYQDTQMLMARQLANPFPPHVLTIVVCWASALFLGNGVVATPNPVTVIAHLAGAIAIATAVFLILELSHPYSGLIRISPAGVDSALRALGAAPRRRRAHRKSDRRGPPHDADPWLQTERRMSDAIRIEKEETGRRGRYVGPGRRRRGRGRACLHPPRAGPDQRRPYRGAGKPARDRRSRGAGRAHDRRRPRDRLQGRPRLSLRARARPEASRLGRRDDERRRSAVAGGRRSTSRA